MVETINYIVEGNQGCPLSPILFSMYINKLKGFLKEEGHVSMTLARIVIILLIYVDDIFLIERSPYDLNNQLSILEDFFFHKDMAIKTNKMKFMLV